MNITLYALQKFSSRYLQLLANMIVFKETFCRFQNTKHIFCFQFRVSTSTFDKSFEETYSFSKKNSFNRWIFLFKRKFSFKLPQRNVVLFLSWALLYSMYISLFTIFYFTKAYIKYSIKFIFSHITIEEIYFCQSNCRKT